MPFEVYPCIILADRYSGAYSGASWTAWNGYAIPAGPEDGDVLCRNFWQDYKGPVGKGSTPNDAYQSLCKQVARREIERGK